MDSEENEVIEVEDDVEEESLEELDKIDKIQREKETFVRQIRSVERQATNIQKLDSIEVKIN